MRPTDPWWAYLIAMAVAFGIGNWMLSWGRKPPEGPDKARDGGAAHPD